MKNFKRMLALLLSIVMIVSVFPMTIFAAGGAPNVSIEVDKTTVNVGDTITVKFNNAEMKITGFTGGFYFDKDLLTCESIVGVDPAYPNDYSLILKDPGRGGPYVAPNAVSNLDKANAEGTVGYAYAGTSDVEYNANTLLVVTFRAEKAGTAAFVVYEQTNGTDAYDNENAETKTVTIKGNEPEVPKCEHTNTMLVDNKNGTHNVVCADANCGETVEENVACEGKDTTVELSEAGCENGSTYRIDSVCDCGYVLAEGAVKTRNDAHGHSWAVKNSYTWNFENETPSCSVTVFCWEYCQEEETIEPYEITSKVTKEATCEEPGSTQYTARFKKDRWQASNTKTRNDFPVALEHMDGDDEGHTCDRDGCNAENVKDCVPGAPVKNIKESTDATCTEGGTLVEDIFCTECGEFIRQITTPIAATCTTGTVEYTWGANNGTCKAQLICEHGTVLKEEEVNTTSEITTNATCTVEEVVTYYADFQNFEDTSTPVTGSTLDHSFNVKASNVEVSAAACEKNQVVKVQCDNCDAISDTKTVEVPNTALEHVDAGKDHVCDRNGCTEAMGEHKSNAANLCQDGKCNYCGADMYATESHNPATDDGDCTSAIACSVCGDEAIPARDHHEDSSDSGHDCDYCDEKDVDDGCYGGNLPTCKTRSVCAECGQEYGVLDSSNHEGIANVYVPNSNKTHDVTYDCCGAVLHDDVNCQDVHTKDHKCDECGAVISTCAEKLTSHDAITGTCQQIAFDAYYSCEVCGKYYSDAQAKTEIAEDSWIGTTDPNNHEQEIKYVNDGMKHKSYYPCCQTEADAVFEDHDYENENRKCVCGGIEAFPIWINYQDDAGATAYKLPQFGLKLAELEYLAAGASGKTKVGHTWAGWKFYSDEACTQEYTGTTVPAHALYAVGQWNPIEQSIQWHDEKGVIIKEADSFYGDVIEAEHAPALNVEGYNISGWTVNGKPAVFPLTVDSSIWNDTNTLEMEPVLTANEYTVTWKIGDQTWTTKATFGEEIVKPTDVVVPNNYYGYKWTSQIPDTMPANENLVIEGNWTVKVKVLGLNGEELQFTTGGLGWDPTTKVVDAGDSVYLNYRGTNFVEGYTLYLVNGDDKYEITYSSGMTEYPTVTVTENTTFQLTKVAKQFTLTVNVLLTDETVELTVPYGAKLLEVLTEAEKAGKLPVIGSKAPTAEDSNFVGEYIFTGYSYKDLEEDAWIDVDETTTMPAGDFEIDQDFINIGWEILDTGVTYHTEQGYLSEGWHYIEENYDNVAGGAWYYFEEKNTEWDGFAARVSGLTRVPYPTEEINGVTYAPDQEAMDYAASKGQTFIDAEKAWFYFDNDGKFVYDANDYVARGENNTGKLVNGMLAWHPGLIKVADNQYRYFIGDMVNGGNIGANGDIYISYNNGNQQFKVGDVYNFVNGALSGNNGIVDGKYYENSRLMMGNGLTKLGDNFIYVRSNGYIVSNTSYWVPVNDKGIEEGLYEFGADGFMIIPEPDPVKDGVYFENGAWFYYENGVIGYNKGLISVTEKWINGDSETTYTGTIYVRSNGQLATGAYYVTNVSGYDGSILSGTRIEFSELGLVKTLKNGICAENGSLYYYQGNKIAYNAGVIEIDGNYYYVRSTGEVVNNCSYWITNVGDSGVVAKKYTFDENGVMQNPEFVKDQLVGIVDGYYYVNGKIAYGAGVVKLSDEKGEFYIYVRSNGQLATGNYWPTNGNGYGLTGSCDFGTDGKLYI